MGLDVSRLINAVQREVVTREHAGAEAKVIVATRTYSTTPADLWDAITNPARLPRWFAPVTGDLRLGGRYSIEGNASGEVLECEPPRRLALTWEFQDKVSWVNVDLEPAAGGTELRLEHIARPDEHWDQFGAGAGGIGWDLALMGLDQHFATTAAVTPAEAMTWLASPEGVAFMQQSNDAWRDATIAAGTDARIAQGAADRTIAAYTGAPAPDA